MAAGGGTRAVLAAFFANLGIAIAKFIGFLFTRSSAMLAESIHSVADTANQGLLLWGGWRWRTHPFAWLQMELSGQDPARCESAPHFGPRV